MTRQEKESYLLELVTMAHQMAADWNEQATKMKRQFDEEWARFKLVVPTMAMNESRQSVENSARGLEASQRSRLQKASEDFTAAYNALTLEYQRAAAELNNPLHVDLRKRAVC